VKYIFIWVSERVSNKFVVYTINHEVCHAVFHILRDLQIPINSETEEIYCYLNQYINERVYKKLNIKFN
jgi:hypothetical protein